MTQRKRSHITIQGAVQGVGFRPFVYRLAHDLDLAGWVLNSGDGVHVEIEGDEDRLTEFIRRVQTDKPPHAQVTAVHVDEADPSGEREFTIRHSSGGSKRALILPDLVTCPDCFNDIRDLENRRYRYPFTNCTNCGPRFTIIERLPYDRPHTTMKRFQMCPECRAEYENPLDRRFHAQPNACPVCGPQVELWDEKGTILCERDEALQQTVKALREGKIVALKGLGGFQLLVRADDEQAVDRLRRRKKREEKPFAVMVRDLEDVRSLCLVRVTEAELLTSPAAPIVLLKRRDNLTELTYAVAPGNPNLGVMLPTTPLHHIILQDLALPVVATSGNLSDEPICIDEHEALERLHGIADLFLVHNRPIARHVDDSVVRVLLGKPQILRRARGYAPLPINTHVRQHGLARADGNSVKTDSGNKSGGSRIAADVPDQNDNSQPILAVGGHLKNTIAYSHGNEVFISQHIGDLETEPALHAFEGVVGQLSDLYEQPPKAIVCDLHPDYESTRYALRTGLPLHQVQHHAAHIYGIMAEHGLAPPVLGFSWDGTGYGPDNTVWGGEVIRINEDYSWSRAAHLRPFRLPGSEAAVKQPRRSLLGLMFAAFGSDGTNRLRDHRPDLFTKQEWQTLPAMLERGVNSPVTTSIGRLFDSIACLVLGRSIINFEGQAAMELEWTAEKLQDALIGSTGADAEAVQPYLVPILSPESSAGDSYTFDWQPLLEAVLEDVSSGVSSAKIAIGFHSALAGVISETATMLNEQTVALSGGVFQNKLLSELAVSALRKQGRDVYWAEQVPPNDGGIAFGQIAAIRMTQKE